MVRDVRTRTAPGSAHLGRFPPDHVWYYAAGSGPLLDGGVYALTALTGLFGPALRVSAMAGTIMSEHVIGNGPAAGRRFRNEVADSVHLHLDFGHFFATFDVSWCVPASRNETLEVYGEHGTLSGDPTYANTPIHIFRPGSGWSVDEPTPRLPRSDDWFLGVAHLVDCVLHDTEPHPQCHTRPARAGHHAHGAAFGAGGKGRWRYRPPFNCRQRHPDEECIRR